MAEQPAIDIKRISKTYRKGVKALDGLSLQVMRGEIFGLLGPNGAGKSTLVKALLTIIRPNVCEGEMLGERIGNRAVLGKIGYLPEHVMFPDYLTGEQVLHYCGGLGKIGKADREKRGDELLNLVGMQDWRSKKIGSYSKGMKQRIGIAQALINDPEIVFLDEPTDGVDPQGRTEIREVMRKIRDSGKTVFINSHLLNELEKVGDRVAILHKGAVVREGGLEELTKLESRYELGVIGKVTTNSQAGKLAQQLGAQIIDDGAGTRVVLPTPDPAAIQPMIDAVRADGLTLAMVQHVRKSLEELFIETIDGASGSGQSETANAAGGGQTQEQ